MQCVKQQQFDAYHTLKMKGTIYPHIGEIRMGGGVSPFC